MTYTLKEALGKYTPDVIRYIVLSHHYSSNVDTLLSRHQVADMENAEPDPELLDMFTEVMDDNLNTAKTIALLSGVFSNINDMLTGKHLSQEEKVRRSIAFRTAFDEIARVLWIFDEDQQQAIHAFTDRYLARMDMTVFDIEELVTQRCRARRDKDYQRADEIRGVLKDRGIKLLDYVGRTDWEVDID